MYKMESLSSILSNGNGPPLLLPDNSSVGGKSDGKSSKGASASSEYPDWKLELTMERLKQKVQQTRSLTDLTKNVHSAIIERRSILDHTDKLNLQKSLDTLQQNIKVNSLQSMVERLEMISRQQGLRFHPGGTGNEWFISSDMFFLELLIGSDGVVQEVKIQHDGKTGQQNCPEIITSLQNNDFVDFSAHLSGLVSIYQLNADKNIKSKVFIALQALESDLSTIASTYPSELIEGDLIVMKSLLGIVKPRTGGHPLKLCFFISPYEFLDTNSKTTLNNDATTIIEKELGIVATVAVQASTSHKLQMSAIVTVLKTDGKSIPRYGTLNATNSTALPACFTFNLQKPVTICSEIVEKIHTITGIQSLDSSTKPILSLLTEFISDGKLSCKNNQGLFVALPDQLHCYFMTETMQLEGVLVSTISFTLASQLPQIIALLRQQLVFNTLIGSCVRPGSKPDTKHIVFEINALSYQNITVTFQHPLEDSLVTLEFDLKDVCHPVCRLHVILANPTVGGGLEIIPTLEEHACRVVQRSMSIPLTLRAVIRRWHTIKPVLEPPKPTFEIQRGSKPTGTKDVITTSSSQESSCRSESGLQSTSHQTPIVPAMVTSVSSKSATKTPIPVSTSSLTISPVPVSNSPAQLEMLTSYMNANPLLRRLSAQFQNMSGLHNISTNATFQMLANQLQQQGAGKPAMPTLMNLLDLDSRGQSSNAAKKRKRKSSSSEPVPILPATNRTTPPSPSGRQLASMKSPKRRMSESSNSDSERVSTPNTIARDLMMSEYGLDSPKWNLDITPVPSMEPFLASKLLSQFGSAAASNIKQERPDTPDHEGNECQFTQPRKQAAVAKRPRDHAPKRSMSLDSSHLQHGNSGTNPASNLMHSLSMQDGSGRQMVPPSLSITPVVSNANTATVNSILAAMKQPGIEIIPLSSNHPITIPNSITVTPIVNKSTSSSNNDKKPIFQKKLSSDEFDILLGKKKRVVEQKRKGSIAEELLKKSQSLERKLAPSSQKMGAGSGFLQMKKPTSPSGISSAASGSGTTISRSSPTPNKSGSPTPLSKIGQGKPSVTTLKSATGSTTTITTTTSKAKPREKKTLTLTTGGSSPKLVPKSTFPNPPPLRPIFDLQSGLPASTIVKSEPTTPTTGSSGNGGNNNGGSLLKGNNKSGFVQTGTVTKKPGGLLAGVIDKLKSQQSVESDSTVKKELSRLDYLKASSTITTEMQKVKGNGNGQQGSGSPGPKAPSPVPTTTPSSQNPVNPEYIVKPGGQGLKLTINKTASGKDKPSGTGKVTGVKRAFSPIGAAKTSTGPKLPPKKPKLESATVASPSGQKIPGRGSPVPQKPKEQTDLTKKLFQSGGTRTLESTLFDAPKFDSTFQIPKKSRTTPPAPSTPVTTPEAVVKEFAKEVTVEKMKEPVVSSPPTPKVAVSSTGTAEETTAPSQAPEVVAAETAESPDASANPDEPSKDTPEIPTTSSIQPEPELPVLENSAPSADDEMKSAPNSPHESTPPVLELSVPQEQSVPVSTTTTSSTEDATTTETTAETTPAVEMPPPPLPPLTPEPTSRTTSSPSVVSTNSPSPLPLIPVGSSVTSTIHIVHSPQPNSPLPSNVLLKSPLVVQSPHSVPASSPYAIDDDLMDEALIGGSGTTSGGGGN